MNIFYFWIGVDATVGSQLKHAIGSKFKSPKIYIQTNTKGYRTYFVLSNTGLNGHNLKGKVRKRIITAIREFNSLQQDSVRLSNVQYKQLNDENEVSLQSFFDANKEIIAKLRSNVIDISSSTPEKKEPTSSSKTRSSRKPRSSRKGKTNQKKNGTHRDLSTAFTGIVVNSAAGRKDQFKPVVEGKQAQEATKEQKSVVSLNSASSASEVEKDNTLPVLAGSLVHGEGKQAQEATTAAKQDASVSSAPSARKVVKGNTSPVTADSLVPNEGNQAHAAATKEEGNRGASVSSELSAEHGNTNAGDDRSKETNVLEGFGGADKTGEARNSQASGSGCSIC